MNILVSACLLGVHCRYDGNHNLCPALDLLLQQHHLIPVCAEQLGGLPTPRIPAERRGTAVITQDGRDVTEAFTNGAQEVLRLAKLYHCKIAILKARSPSCGYGTIYDGTFTRTLTERDGVTAELLRAHGISVYTEQDLETLPFVQD